MFQVQNPPSAPHLRADPAEDMAPRHVTHDAPLDLTPSKSQDHSRTSPLNKWSTPYTESKAKSSHSVDSQDRVPSGNGAPARHVLPSVMPIRSSSNSPKSIQLKSLGMQSV